MIYKYLIETSTGRVVGQYEFDKPLTIPEPIASYRVLVLDESKVVYSQQDDLVKYIDQGATQNSNSFFRPLSYWKYSGYRPQLPLTGDYVSSSQTFNLSRELPFFEDTWGMDLTIKVPNALNTSIYKIKFDGSDNNRIDIATTAGGGLRLDLLHSTFDNPLGFGLISDNVVGKSVRIILTVETEYVLCYIKTEDGDFGGGSAGVDYPNPETKVEVTVSELNLIDLTYTSRPLTTSEVNTNLLTKLRVLSSSSGEPEIAYAIRDTPRTPTFSGATHMKQDGTIISVPELVDDNIIADTGAVYEGINPQRTTLNYQTGAIDTVTLYFNQESVRSINPRLRMIVDNEVRFEQEIVLTGTGTLRAYQINFDQAIEFSNCKLEIISGGGSGKFTILEVKITSNVKVAKKLIKQDDGTYLRQETGSEYTLIAGETVVETLPIRNEREHWVEDNNEYNLKRISKSERYIVALPPGAEELSVIPGLINADNLGFVAPHRGQFTVNTEVELSYLTNQLRREGLVEVYAETETNLTFGNNFTIKTLGGTTNLTSPYVLEQGSIYKISKALNGELTINKISTSAGSIAGTKGSVNNPDTNQWASTKDISDSISTKYSTTETKTLDTWIDNSSIYRRAFDSTSLTNNGITTLDNSGSVKQLVSVNMAAIMPDGGSVVLPLNDNGGSIIVFTRDSNLNVFCNRTDFGTGISVYGYIEYTKNN